MQQTKDSASVPHDEAVHRPQEEASAEEDDQSDLQEKNEQAERIEEFEAKDKKLEYIRAQRGKRYGAIFGTPYIIGGNECFPLYYRIIIDKTKFI